MFSSEVFSSGEGTPVATRDVFSEDELAQLRGFPEPARAELIRYFTLARADQLDNAPVDLSRPRDRPGLVHVLWHVTAPSIRQERLNRGVPRLNYPCIVNREFPG